MAQLSDLVQDFDEARGFDVLRNKNGDLAVLISPGYGGGWSTWCSESRKMLADARIIRFFLENYGQGEKSSRDQGPMETFLESLGLEDFTMVGFRNLEVQFVPKGSLFQVHEYDGSEYIVLFDEKKWERA